MKLCLFCHKPSEEWENPKRRSKWCCEECRIKYQSRCDKRRQKYDENKEVVRLVNQMYSLSKRIAHLIVPKPADFEQVPPGTYELHHTKFLGSLDPCTFVWEKREQHHKDHSNLPDVNFVDYFTILRLRPDIYEEYAKKYREEMDNGTYSVEELPCVQVMKRFKLKKEE